MYQRHLKLYITSDLGYEKIEFLAEIFYSDRDSA